jgi:hypothetical protein
MAFIIRGSGRRTAESYEGGSSQAALLHVEYTTGTARLAAQVQELPASIAELTLSQNQVIAYPNPFTRKITVDLAGSGAQGTGVLYLIGADGRTVSASEYDGEQQPLLELDTEKLAAGTYIIRIRRENGSTIQGRFIKQ